MVSSSGSMTAGTKPSKRTPISSHTDTSTCKGKRYLNEHFFYANIIVKLSPICLTSQNNLYEVNMPLEVRQQPSSQMVSGFCALCEVLLRKTVNPLEDG